MQIYLEERIGEPELFSGRKKEMSYFLDWIHGIKRKKSKSHALMARRKMGKTAIMERLFNITFEENNGVIPFYYEIREEKFWVLDFAKDFFLTFIFQYIAFKTRNPEYLAMKRKKDFEEVKGIIRKEKLDFLLDYIKGAEYCFNNEHTNAMWQLARETPHELAHSRGEYIVQMIDEFQFLTSQIYHDKEMKNPGDDIAGGYLGIAESKIAPLLVSGSWVGWLMHELQTRLPTRFKYYLLRSLNEKEAIEMIFQYSDFFGVPVIDESAHAIWELTEGSPFYISAVLRSSYEDKNLTTKDGVVDTLNFEILSLEGEIKMTWMEYIRAAFPRINGDHKTAGATKQIVIYLCKNKDREVTRKELLDKLPLDMSDADLEKKLEALVRVDVIDQGQTNFDFRVVPDNIFDKVFRGVYQKEIDGFDIEEIRQELQDLYEQSVVNQQKILGQYNQLKGLHAEQLILRQFRHNVAKKNASFCSVTENLPKDFRFVPYSFTRSFIVDPEYSREMQVDIYARAEDDCYSVIGEVKNRSTKKFSLQEARDFRQKLEAMKEREKIKKAIGFIFSRNGFNQNAEAYLKKSGIAYSSDEKWLGEDTPPKKKRLRATSKVENKNA